MFVEEGFEHQLFMKRDFNHHSTSTRRNRKTNKTLQLPENATDAHNAPLIHVVCVQRLHMREVHELHNRVEGLRRVSLEDEEKTRTDELHVPRTLKPRQNRLQLGDDGLDDADAMLRRDVRKEGGEQGGQG